MVSSKPGQDLAALSSYAKAHGMSYGELVAKIGPARERAIIEDYMAHEAERNAERKLARIRKNQEEWDRQMALKYWREGNTDKEIADKLGISSKVVSCWRHRLKLEVHPEQTGDGKRGNLKIDREKALQMYRDGYTDREIAKAFHATAGGVSNWRRQNNLPSQQERKRSEKWQEVQELIQKGYTVTQIAMATARSYSNTLEYLQNNGAKIGEGGKVLLDP